MSRQILDSFEIISAIITKPRFQNQGDTLHCYSNIEVNNLKTRTLKKTTDGKLPQKNEKNSIKQTNFLLQIPNFTHHIATYSRLQSHKIEIKIKLEKKLQKSLDKVLGYVYTSSIFYKESHMMKIALAMLLAAMFIGCSKEEATTQAAPAATEEVAPAAEAMPAADAAAPADAAAVDAAAPAAEAAAPAEAAK
jgi:hypothetical protein